MEQVKNTLLYAMLLEIAEIYTIDLKSIHNQHLVRKYRRYLEKYSRFPKAYSIIALNLLDKFQQETQFDFERCFEDDNAELLFDKGEILVKFGSNLLTLSIDDDANFRAQFSEIGGV